jgi:hypothetical protein
MSPITGEIEHQPILIEDLGEDSWDEDTQQTVKMTEVYSNDNLPYNKLEMLNEEYYREDTPKFDAEMNIHICDEALKD